MSERRMFSKAVVSTDDFTEMPLSTQALYFHLGINADDDGFVSNVRAIQAYIGARVDDLRVLISKGYVFQTRSGVYIIRHWKQNNYIQSDRYKPTVYQAEFALLRTTENREYEFIGEENEIVMEIPENIENKPAAAMDTERIQNVSKLDTQNRKEEKREEKKREDKHIPERHIYGEFQRVLLTDEEYRKLVEQFGEESVRSGIRYIDESAETTGNKNHWKNWYLVIRKCLRDGWNVGKPWNAPKQKTLVSEQNYDDMPDGWEDFEV